MLKALSYYMVYVEVDQMAHLSERRLNVRGVVTSGMEEIDKTMINSRQTLRVSVLKLASMYKKGLSLNIKDPQNKIVPLYNKITEYLTAVGTYLGSPGFKTLASNGRAEYEKLLLKDAFILEYLADALYPKVCTFDLNTKVKQKTQSTDILDLFKRHITSSADFQDEDIAKEHIESYMDIDQSPHRLGLRKSLSEETIYKYEDMTEFDL